jgi:hypothetical protein
MKKGEKMASESEATTIHMVAVVIVASAARAMTKPKALAGTAAAVAEAVVKPVVIG